MLNTVPLALVTASTLVDRHLHSALPGAPVLAAPARPATPVARRTRRAMASALHRAANVVAPA